MNRDDELAGIASPSSATNSFIYNGEDLRVSKTDSAGTSAVVTDGTSPASSVLKDARAVYTPGNSERASGTSKFFHGDALGSTRGITNGSQTVVGTLNLDGFGNSVGSTGSSSSPYMYAATSGYRNDGDSGLTHVGARYYDAQVGRFISRDTLWISLGLFQQLIDMDIPGSLSTIDRPRRQRR